MTEQAKGCGGSGTINIRFESRDGVSTDSSPCPGCDDCKPTEQEVFKAQYFNKPLPKCETCGSDDYRVREKVGPMMPMKILRSDCNDRFHDSPKCGTCGGSGEVEAKKQDQFYMTQYIPCPDCTPKPPDSIAGIDPDITGGKSVEQHLKDKREEPPASSDEAHGDCGRFCECYFRGNADGQEKDCD